MMETADGPHGDSGSRLLISFFSQNRNMAGFTKEAVLIQLLHWIKIGFASDVWAKGTANHRMQKNSATDFLKEQINQEMALCNR